MKISKKTVKFTIIVVLLFVLVVLSNQLTIRYCSDVFIGTIENVEYLSYKMPCEILPVTKITLSNELCPQQEVYLQEHHIGFINMKGSKVKLYCLTGLTVSDNEVNIHLHRLAKIEFPNG